MLRAYKYRISPTSKQAVLLNKHIGAVRFIYNLALETKKTAYDSKKVNLSRYDLQEQLKDLKTECEWLTEINSQSLQAALMNLDTAYSKFFKGKSNFPKFKKKISRGNFSVPQGTNLKNNTLYIPKFREGIKIVLHRPIKGDIKQATISRTPTGKYFVSILCETGDTVPPKEKVIDSSVVGLDLGIKSFIVTSDGEGYANPKYLRSTITRLKYVQRKLSKNKGKRTRQKFATLHEKIANQRKDFLHKISNRLIRENQSLAIEDLNINGMIKNHKVAQAISDASWGAFVQMLEYKALWYGKHILKIGRFEASSKTCSNCNGIYRALSLVDREWNCLDCGAFHDRDVNAAINIRNFAVKNYLSAEHRLKNQSELPTLVGVMTSEVIGLPCNSSPNM